MSRAWEPALGPQLEALDRHNLTGPYALNLMVKLIGLNCRFPFGYGSVTATCGDLQVGASVDGLESPQPDRAL
jgi:hypothetical protein